jgi:uncharacterized damage-inducible protein DinB
MTDLIEFFLPEFDHEMAVTRRLLERVPDGALAWKPHDRSFSMGALSTHLAQLPRWGRTILDRESYDLAESAGRSPVEAGSQAEMLRLFDEHVADVRRALTASSDAVLRAPWALRQGGQVLMSMPRLAALRRFLLHHVIHHRGQLTVYLRLQNVPVPPIYGPTADERP